MSHAPDARPRAGSAADARADRPDWSRRPGADQVAPGHVAYVARVPDGDLLATLEREGALLASWLRAIPPDFEHHRYATDKWSVRELAGHCADTERVLVYRALTFARGDAGPLPGFEEGDWARASNAARRPLPEIVEEWEAVRRASLLFFRGLDAAALDRRGTANGVSVTVRGLAWTVAGHAAHHRAILEERYLGR